MARGTRAQWADRVRRWKSSGLTAAEYARRHRLKGSTLVWWSSALCRSERLAPGFVEVVQPPVARSADGHIELVLRGELRIRVSGLFDPEVLLQARRCARGPVMLPTATRILVCTQPQDMRRSFDGLALVARELLGEDPRSGALYVFVSKSATRVKVLWWDRNGYCLLYKRLHRALFVAAPEAAKVGAALQIDGEALADLLTGVEKKSRDQALKTH